MSKNLIKVNTESEAIEAQKNLEEPFVILVKDENKLIYRDDSHCDVTMFIDDWNNYHTEIPVIQRDISWIKGRRCLVKKTEKGVAICYLDENNSEYFHDGTTVAKLDGTMGQWMTDLPEFNIECVQGKSDWVKIHISKDKEIGHKSRRVLLGVTKAVNREDKLWSCKYYPDATYSVHSSGNLTPISFHNKAIVLGNGFDIVDYESHCKVAYMFMAKYKNRDPQNMSQFGMGTSEDIVGITAGLGNNDGHGSSHISIFGAEDWYSSKFEIMSGIHSNGKTYYIYDGFEPDKVPTTPYRTISLSKPITTNSSQTWERHGYISRMEWGEYADLIPAETEGTSRYFYTDNGNVGNSGFHIVTRSGNGNSSTNGLFLFHADGKSEFAFDFCGSRIQYRGEIEVIDDPQEFIALPVGF